MKDQSYLDALLNLLRRTKEIPFINSESGYKLDLEQTPRDPGVFCIWWMQGNILWKDRNYLQIKLSSPSANGAFVPYKIDTEMLLLDNRSGPLPLYVGKTEDIGLRLSEHLMTDVKKLPESQLTRESFSSLYSIFRVVFDQLFPYLTDMIPLIRRYLNYSWVKLPGDNNVFLRYYLKNYSIGKLRPICNINVFELIT